MDRITIVDSDLRDFWALSIARAEALNNCPAAGVYVSLGRLLCQVADRMGLLAGWRDDLEGFAHMVAGSWQGVEKLRRDPNPYATFKAKLLAECTTNGEPWLYIVPEGD